MKSARNKRHKANFIKKIKYFFLYSFISIVVIGFFLNSFISNILEYSFALANNGGIIDLKTDEKYSIVLISSNKLNEVKELSLISYDKKNRRLTNFDINLNFKLADLDNSFLIKDLLLQKSSKSKGNLEEILVDNFGTNLAFTYILSSDDYDLIKKLAIGNGSLLDLYEARRLSNISLRDLYFVYSFSGSIDAKDKRFLKIGSSSELDREFRDFYMDSRLGEESLSITVVNAAQVNGLGRKYTRIISNKGGRVVDTTNANQKVLESFIIYKQPSETLTYISNQFGITKSLSIEEVGLRYPEIIKSDLVIVLGVDRAE
jgi:hypothetical protein